MDPTQRIDPNRTMLTGAPGTDLRTQMMAAQDPLADPNRTSAMGAMGGPALVAEIVAGREATMANGPAREQFLIEFTAGGSAAMGGRTPLNLCLVIDRSGSMEGPPLDYVKQACCHVVDLLSPNDVLSIVTFEEVVEVLMPAQCVTNKQPIKDGINRLMPGNTTDLHGGMSLALQQVLAQNEPGRATRMIVFTDGDPTAGIKDHPSLVSHAGDVRSRGVTITFIGFGPDYNEELLASMAKRSGGNYYYIHRPELIPEVFRTELDKLMTVSARNVRVDMKLARWVSARAPQAATSGGEFSLSLADMERGTSLQQVLDLEFSNHPLGFYRVAAGRLTYEDCGTGKTETVDLDFVIEFTADSARYAAPVNPRVQQAAQIVMASRAVEQTIMGMKTGQLTQAGAIQELQKTQALLLQQGKTGEAQEVTLALRALQSGDQGQAEKTLMGTMVSLDQGKKTT
ncbi:MAG: VWA domain-containing protein [Fimbriimonas ginsengisoli]|uniref:VWA domain-containing protein n=1 Tax=Fimbriimonas ginsengisoli TaxID=1005039 RepID=A0A931LSH1_FIMGI|nr:VWA domain-containing protein [Fimbriimonas ginsengisoli]